MQLISLDELINIKILPFNIYNQNGDLIYTAGEILTPGKLLKLRYIPAIYKDEEPQALEDAFEKIDEVEEVEVVEPEAEIEEPSLPEEKSQKLYTNVKPIIKASMPERSKRTIKSLYTEALEMASDEESHDEAEIFVEVRDKIVEETLPLIDNIIYKSDLKVIGEYDKVHGVNVSILSAALAAKLKFNENQIKDVTLAALLHDIGMLKLPKDILDPPFNNKKTRLLHLHPQIGYRMIKKDLGLPDYIAKVALEHHEKNDGSGYPFRISRDLISVLSQVVIVCNFYDELMSNKSSIKVKNAKEAIKKMMAIGSKSFTPSILYTFVYMSNYNDTTKVESYNS